MATVTSDSRIAYVVDDDEDVAQYDGLPILVVPRTGSMNGALQAAVDLINETEDVDYYGFVGDDHRFRTSGWDRRIMEVLDAQGGGFAYGNDMNRTDIPTEVFVSACIVQKLGYFGLRGCHHLYLDDAWRVLGDGADCLYFLPNIVIEHVHPAYGKAEWDENYKRVNSAEMYSHDRDVFQTWLQTRSEYDIETVRRAIGRS